MKIIDTDIIIDYLNGIKDAQNFLTQISKSDRFVTSINLMELFYGCQNKKEVQEAKKFIYLNFNDILQIDERASAKAVELIEKYSKSHGLELADALIAALTMVKGATLLSGNFKDFAYIEGLKVEKVSYK